MIYQKKNCVILFKKSNEGLQYEKYILTYYYIIDL
jgi:hypothetical protein